MSWRDASISASVGSRVKGLLHHARSPTQEDFSDSSSRTYLSSLERKLKSPTLDKLAQLAAVLRVHPVTLVALSTLAAPEMRRVMELLTLLDRELGSLTAIGPDAG